VQPTSWDDIITRTLAGIQAFRIHPAPSRGADAHFYWDTLNANGGTGHISSASTGFGVLGLCLAARMGRMSLTEAATKLQQTLTAFDTHWWPWCERDRLCPHWMNQVWDNNAGALRMALWGNSEYSTIDTALHVCGA
jgi:hypothetical protein